MRMEAGLDTGPILLQRSTAIEDDDDAPSLAARLAAIGAELVIETLERLEDGSLVERPQDDALATSRRASTSATRWSTGRSRPLRCGAARAPSIPGRVCSRCAAASRSSSIG